MPDRILRASGQHKRRRSRLPLVALSVVTVFAAFGVIVWFSYEEDARFPIGEPPLVKAAAGSYKYAPDDPGGRQVADQGEINRLLRDEPGPATPERVLPPPEEPRDPTLVPQDEAPALTEDGADASEVAQTSPDNSTVEAAGTDGQTEAQARAEDSDAQEEAEAALARLLGDVGPASTGETSELVLSSLVESVVCDASSVVATT
ncbi:MAG: hypothetical protein AAF637_09140 [Pseudomonadota bacterium]